MDDDKSGNWMSGECSLIWEVVFRGGCDVIVEWLLEEYLACTLFCHLCCLRVLWCILSCCMEEGLVLQLLKRIRGRLFGRLQFIRIDW